jgi:hypothetical protein
VGNPVTDGATLTVTAHGGTSTIETYAVPPGMSAHTSKPKPFWSGDLVKGFTYVDAKGENGPVKIAHIKKSSRGQFQLNAVVDGELGAISIVPPNDGTDGCALLIIGGGARFDATYGTSTRNTAGQFSAKAD